MGHQNRGADTVAADRVFGIRGESIVNFWWDERLMNEQNSQAPTILAIGDSWFWYPFYGGSLIDKLGEVVRSKGNTIYAKGMNGAEAFDYVDGKYAKQVEEALRKYGSSLQAVFISGGGNDFAGFADLRPLLKSDCSAESIASGCFVNSPGLDTFLSSIDHFYRRLVGTIHASTPPSCKIILHTYDYAIPDGRSLSGKSWLKAALDDANVPRNLQDDCVRLLIDRFADVLSSICRSDPSSFMLVDSRGTLDGSGWANELHPTPDGFRKLAYQSWRPVLRDAGLAH